MGGERGEKGAVLRSQDARGPAAGPAAPRRVTRLLPPARHAVAGALQHHVEVHAWG